MKHITTQDALRALEEAVAEKGEDYIYEYPITDDSLPFSETCLYVYQGAPSCLVGHALVRLGIPVDAFAPYEGKEIGELMTFVDWPIEVYAVDVLAAAQQEQDGHRSWGEALLAAQAEVLDA